MFDFLSNISYTMQAYGLDAYEQLQDGDYLYIKLPTNGSVSALSLELVSYHLFCSGVYSGAQEKTNSGRHFEDFNLLIWNESFERVLRISMSTNRFGHGTPCLMLWGKKTRLYEFVAGLLKEVTQMCLQRLARRPSIEEERASQLAYLADVQYVLWSDEM